MSDTSPEKFSSQSWPPYQVRARNISRDAGPSVHSDEVARSLGFKGALVAGRAIYSHLLHPLLERFGEAMLCQGRCQVRFFKPAYEGDSLTIRTAPAPRGETAPGGVTAPHENQQRAVQVTAENEAGEVLARLEASLPHPFPAPHARGRLAPAAFDGDSVFSKAEGDWEALELERPLAAHSWRPTAEDNLEWCTQIGESLPLFQSGEAPPLHPGLVPTATTAMLHEQLLIRGWVHVSSEFITHGLPRAGAALELRATPIEKWEQKGRRFVKLYVAVVESGQVLVEEIRTALIREESRG